MIVTSKKYSFDILRHTPLSRFQLELVGHNFHGLVLGCNCFDLEASLSLVSACQAEVKDEFILLYFLFDEERFFSFLNRLIFSFSSLRFGLSFAFVHFCL